MDALQGLYKLTKAIHFRVDVVVVGGGGGGGGCFLVFLGFFMASKT